MPLQFILGSSGSGKSRYLYETVIKESLAAPKENFLILVPEQFTMEIQRNLIELHPRKGILNIDVLSFQFWHSVFWRIWELTGDGSWKRPEKIW